MKTNLFALAALLIAAAEPAHAADAVDPAVVGTWKLEWQRQTSSGQYVSMASTGCTDPAPPRASSAK